MKKQIKIRVDASSEIGFGHLTRCCALINSLTETHVIFYSTEPISNIVRQMCTINFTVITLTNSNDFTNHIEREDLIIIDGYQFDTSYYAKLKLKGAKVICIDDLANQHLPVDSIVNPTPGFDASTYSSLLSTQYFLGLDFALLRSSFQELACTQSNTKIENSLFICFGGSDPLNKTLIAYKAALDSQNFSEIHIVLGPGYSFELQLENSTVPVTIYRDLQEKEMASLMSQMEYGIIPTSGILLECLAAKIKLISGYYIENQQFVYAEHLKLNSFVDASDLSYKAILSGMNEVKRIHSTQITIDGKSTERLIKMIHSIQSESHYHLRLATAEDNDTTYEWANQEATRKYAFSKDFIPFENHTNWFLSKLASAHCLYFILTEREKPIGSIRFDLNGSVATISYLLDPITHGKGLGTILMKKGLEMFEHLIDLNEIKIIQGYVLMENIPSVKLFERFGFKVEIESNMYLFKKNTRIHV
ncbi:MAG: UDP-2,4-diacetamido-2,4,6-trideoxy-beta-L-altropyranose hydrolase [Flavobacteriia bacterium]